MIAPHRWLVVLYPDDKLEKPLTTFWCNTIRDAAHLLDETPTTVSNTYHRLIRPKNAMRFIRLYKYYGERKEKPT